MAIILRSVKGSPLTHNELDTNFTEFFYSASIDGSSLKFHKFTADSSSLTVPTNPSSGPDGFIQLSTGTAITASFTHSIDLKLDRTTSTLYLTGSGNISGDLVVGGDITAERFLVEYITSSVVFESGSTKFGNTPDDTHDFTGTVDITRNLTVNSISASTLISSSDTYIDDWNSISGSLSNLTSNITNLSESVSNTYLLNTTDSFTGTLTIVGTADADDITIDDWNSVSSSLSSLNSSITALSQSASDTYLLNTTDTLTGTLTIAGTADADDITIDGWGSVSASLAAISGGLGGATIANDVNNRITTAVGNGTLNGEANLTFDGGTLGVSGSIDVLGQINLGEETIIREFDAADTGIVNLVGGTNHGTVIEGDADGHVVIGLRNDDGTDSFSIVAGDGGIYYGSGYNKLAFQVSGSGNTMIGKNLWVSGSIQAEGDIIAFSSSDIRFKNNITPIESPIEKIKAIGGYEFDWNDLQGTHKGHDVGVIAQEIEKVLPEVVHTRPDSYKAVRYEKIVALLIEAIKEQEASIQELKQQVQLLQDKN